MTFFLFFANVLFFFFDEQDAKFDQSLEALAKANKPEKKKSSSTGRGGHGGRGRGSGGRGRGSGRSNGKNTF